MSDSNHPVNFSSYIRTCAVVFCVALVAIACMIGVSFSHIGGWPLKVTLILALAITNAFLVAGYLMHLLSERKLVYTVMGFTIFFFAGLMGLTLWAMQDFPVGTAVH